MKVCFLRSPTVGFMMVLLMAGYEQVAPPKDVVLPAARSAADSLAAIRVPRAFRVELVAAEPMVMDPIDISFGPDGRMWVVEMTDYPSGIDGQGRAGGRVRVLESSRNDGRYDKSTIFAENLNFPNSVVPWRDGVLVVAAPDILYLEDTDGDGRADRVESRFKGFGEGNEQHRANGLQWGLDGWLYLANGDSGGKIGSARGGPVIDIGRRDLRVRPDEGEIEPVAGRTQWGRNRDDWGNWFGGNNSNPIWHYALNDAYLARNPHYLAPNAVVTVPAVPGPAPIYPASQTLARFNDADRANRFTSACGTMVYRDDILGPEFAGNIFVCEPVHNLVNRQVITARGATFAGTRAPGDQQAEFFASADHWSRFTAARTGPDGALYIVDMYRQAIEHPKWIPDAWQKVLGDLRAGADQGRIYRIVPEGRPLRAIPRLDRLDTAGLIAALGTPNGTVRDLVQQVLTWRGDKSAAPALEKMVAESPLPQARLQALCTLDTLHALRPEAVAIALRDPHAGVLRHAVRLSERFARAGNTELLAAVAKLTGHPDAFVRQQVAYTLGEWNVPSAGTALAELLRRETDIYVQAAAMSSALPHANHLLAGFDPARDRALVDVAIATRHGEALARVLRSVSAPRPPAGVAEQFAEFAVLLDRLQRAKLSLEALAAIENPALREAVVAARAVFGAVRTIAADAHAPLPQRMAAVGILARDAANRDEDAAALGQLIVPQEPVELQLAALTALGHTESPDTAGKLLAGWASHGPKVRAAVLDLLASRPAWTNALLDRLEADRSMLPQIDLGRRTTLGGHSDRKIALRAQALFSADSNADRQQVITRYLTAMRGLKPDAGRGAEVFANVCVACHKFGRVPGQAIGPDLGSIKDRSPEYLVAHILDPNRAVEDRYMLSSAGTRDGKTYAGMITGESGNSITLVGLDGTEQVLLRTDISWITTSGRSLMPDGLEGAIDSQAMVDLVAFLARSDAAK